MPLKALKQAYDSTLLENTATLVQVESALRNLTWFLPGRFQDAELASEGVYSALSLVSLYHDSIISRRLKQVDRLPESPFRKTDTVAATKTTTKTFPEDPLAEPLVPLGQSLPLPSEHTRYTSHFARTSGVYATAGRTLVVLGYVQLLLEMVVVRGRRSEGAGQREGGRWRRWRVLVWLEAVKTALRLSILLKTRRPLLAFPLPQREIDPSVLAQPDASPPTTTSTTQQPAIPYLVSTLPPGTQPHTHLTPLLPRLPETYQPPAEALLPVISGWRETLGETMHASEGLVAVLVYTLLARRRRAARQSTGMAALARDSLATSIVPLAWSLVARMLRRRAPKPADPMAQLMGMMGSPGSDTGGMTPLLAETYAARDRALLWNFVRGAIWQRWTRGKVMRCVEALEGVWGVRLVAGIVRDHVELVDEFYYYTAT